MHPNIDNVDEYVRNTTARAFSVVASALGIPTLLPFLRAVCASKKSWQVRHTCIKIMQQIAILMGCAVMVVLIREFQSPDEEMKKLVLKVVKQSVGTDGMEPDYIRTEILPEYFKHFWVRRMALDRRNYKQLVETTVEIANKVSRWTGGDGGEAVWGNGKQHSTDGVEPDYIRTEILPEYFKPFWVRHMALDRRNYKQLVETTVEIANKAGVSDMIGRVVEDLKDESELSFASPLTICPTSPYPSLKKPAPPSQAGLSDIIGRVVEDLKDESEPYRRMVMETVEKVLTNLGAADIDAWLEELLIDGILYAF
ncbi:unnamed protein product [Closterium sp. Naga37s-1]|nr:unnamed protein product [Closterium sp. Naga37s-1]